MTPIWNVRCTIVDLVPAATAEEAIGRLNKRLSGLGLEIYVEADAFESEPLDADVEATVRTEWSNR